MYNDTVPTKVMHPSNHTPIYILCWKDYLLFLSFNFWSYNIPTEKAAKQPCNQLRIKKQNNLSTSQKLPYVPSLSPPTTPHPQTTTILSFKQNDRFILPVLQFYVIESYSVHYFVSGFFTRLFVRLTHGVACG